jgi:hypothetical protein
VNDRVHYEVASNVDRPSFAWACIKIQHLVARAQKTMEDVLVHVLSRCISCDFSGVGVHTQVHRLVQACHAPRGRWSFVVQVEAKVMVEVKDIGSRRGFHLLQPLHDPPHTPRMQEDALLHILCLDVSQEVANALCVEGRVAQRCHLATMHNIKQPLMGQARSAPFRQLACSARCGLEQHPLGSWHGPEQQN